MSAFVSPASVPDPAPDSFGTCECGHRIYDHGRHNQDGNQIWDGCRDPDCDCPRFRASDGSAWPNSYGGATVDDPDDLDRETDHWVGGQVLLTGEEPPL